MARLSGNNYILTNYYSPSLQTDKAYAPMLSLSAKPGDTAVALTKKILITLLITLFCINSHADFLDTFIHSYKGQKPNALGPNCFGTAFAASIPDFIYTGYMHEGEFQALLNSPLCQEISPTGNLERRTILSVKVTKTKKERLFSQFVHAAIFLEDNQVFEKSFYSSSDKPKIISMAKSLEPYTLRSLNEVRRSSTYARNNIGTSVVSYTCESIETYLKREHADWMQENRRFWKKLVIEQNNIKEWTQGTNTFIDALRACSQRLLTLEGELTRAHTARVSELMNEDELKNREAQWLKVPQWATLLTIARIQSMNKQVQLLIGAKIPLDSPKK